MNLFKTLLIPAMLLGTFLTSCNNEEENNPETTSDIKVVWKANLGEMNNPLENLYLYPAIDENDNLYYVLNNFTLNLTTPEMVSVSSSGQVRWRTLLDEGFGDVNSYPVFSNGKVFQTFNNHLYCFNAGNGTLEWKKNLPGDADYFSSVAVKDNRLYVSSTIDYSDTRLFCYGLDGSEIFTKDFPDMASSGPVIIHGDQLIIWCIQDPKILITSLNGELSKLINLHDDGYNLLQVPSVCPVIDEDGNLIFAASRFEDSKVYFASYSQEGTENWRYDSDNQLSQITLDGDNLLLALSDLVCLNAGNGSVNWTVSQTWLASFGGNVLAANAGYFSADWIGIACASNSSITLDDNIFMGHGTTAINHAGQLLLFTAVSSSDGGDDVRYLYCLDAGTNGLKNNLTWPLPGYDYANTFCKP